MKLTKSLVTLAVVIICIVGVLFFVYQKYEKPKNENFAEQMNISISAINDDKQIVTDLQVRVNSFFVKNITTTSHGFVLFQAPVNSTVTLLSTSDDYYHTAISKKLSASMTRMTVELFEAGNITTNHSLDINNNQINIEVQSDGLFKNPKICVNWGLHIIWLNSLDELRQVNDDEYPKCFAIDDVNESSVMYSFSYDNYGVFAEIDFVRFYIIDEQNNTFEHKVKFINI